MHRQPNKVFLANRALQIEICPLNIPYSVFSSLSLEPVHTPHVDRKTLICKLCGHSALQFHCGRLCDSGIWLHVHLQVAAGPSCTAAKIQKTRMARSPFRSSYAFSRISSASWSEVISAWRFSDFSLKVTSSVTHFFSSTLA